MGRLAALLGPLVAYYELAPHLWQAGTWWDVAWITCVLMPAVFGLVLLALPLREARRLLPAGLALAVLAAVLTIMHANIGANFARLGATTLLGASISDAIASVLAPTAKEGN